MKVSQYSPCSVYNFFIKNCLSYLNEIYVPLEVSGVHMHSSYQKLNVPQQKTNTTKKTLSFFGSSLWNNLDKTLKTSTGLNTFKHNIKQHYFNELNEKNSLNSSFCIFDVSK